MSPPRAADRRTQVPMAPPRDRRTSPDRRRSTRGGRRLAERPVTTRQLADLFGSEPQFIADQCRLPSGEFFGTGKSWLVGRDWRIAYAAAVAFLTKRGIPVNGLLPLGAVDAVDAAGEQTLP